MYNFKEVPSDYDEHLLLMITVLVIIHKNYLKCLCRIQILHPCCRARESESLGVGTMNLHFTERFH